MVGIIKQKQARQVQSRDFCYLCGQNIEGYGPTDKDHVPPRGMFKKEDRDYPIILPVHEKCNDAWQTVDDKVKLLIDILHGKDITRYSGKYRAEIAEDKDGTLYPLIGDMPLIPMIGRIVRGFHAALYNEYLPPNTENKILSPVPKAEIIDGKVSVKRVLPQFYICSEILKRSIEANATDKIYSNNSKMRYECTWPQLDNGRRYCVFALDIYNWANLGNDVTAEEHACIGMYFLNGHMPKNATAATKIVDPFRTGEAFNPFV